VLVEEALAGGQPADKVGKADEECDTHIAAGPRDPQSGGPNWTPGAGPSRRGKGAKWSRGGWPGANTSTSAELLFEVVGPADERTSLIVTTELRSERWTDVTGSERLTGEFLDRLTPRIHIIEANGKSHRLRDSRERLRRRGSADRSKT
jgi:hypothetical protein